MDLSKSNLRCKNHCIYHVKVPVDYTKYNKWCIEHIGYDWYKEFGFTGIGSTYYFPTGEDAVAFKIWAGV